MTESTDKTDQMRGVLERVVRAGMLLPEQEADQ